MYKKPVIVCFYSFLHQARLLRTFGACFDFVNFIHRAMPYAIDCRTFGADFTAISIYSA